MTQHYYRKKQPALYVQIMKKHTTPADAKANVSAAIGELMVLYCVLMVLLSLGVKFVRRTAVPFGVFWRLSFLLFLSLSLSLFMFSRRALLL